jgi:two-component system, NarL family, sensor histidine kinase DegS
MTKPVAPNQGSSHDLLARLEADVATLDLELAEVDMLLGQVKSESVRHEQKRAQAADKLGQSDRKGERGDQADAYAQLAALTRRAAVMDAQASILESKQRSLVRHRDAIAAIAAEVAGLDPSAPAAAPGGGAEEVLTPPLTRVVLVAQEDLRREIARAMHDGPAQSLTNIVLQAAIVERLLNRDPTNAKGELRQLVSMVQQTLDATKTFIFDVRPMVLDDLGLVPTMRRAARDRGRRSHVPVEFDSLGMDIRLPMEVESAVFRILDEALAGYLSLNPDRVTLRLDWGDILEARIGAQRAVAAPVDTEPLPQVPAGGDVPDAIKQMIQDRHDKRQAAVEEAEAAAIVVLPSATRRDVTERATSIGGTVEILAGGSELRLVVPLPAAGEPGPAA